MANVRIKDLTTTAATTASDDFFGVDGATNGTRKLNAYSPTFGGNLTVSGTGASSFGTGADLLSITPSTGIISFLSAQPIASIVVGNTNAVNKYGQIQWLNSVNQLSIGTQGQYGSGALNIATNGNALLGTTSDGGQKLQVAGTVAKTAAGPTTIAIASNEAFNLRDEGRLFIVGNASAGSRYLGLEYYDVGNGAYRNVAAVPNGGNFLVGTTTDGGQKLQVSGTIAASLGVSSNGSLAAFPAANSAAMDWNGGYARFWGVGADASTAGGLKLVVSSTDGSPFVEALTIASSGDATFAGNITRTRSAAGSTGSAVTDYLVRLGNSTSPSAAGVLASNIGLSNFRTSLVLRTTDTSGNAVDAATFDYAGDATFAGAIAINNTVNTVSPTSPNRTITMVIGGTTYYIHAKTTND